MTSYTASFQFEKINYATRNWQTNEYANWDKLDALLSTLVTESAIPFAVAAGAVNAYTAAYTPAITSYTTGLLLSFLSNNANTGAATINVNSLGAKNLFRSGVALTTGIIPANTYVKIIYDGIRFQVLEPRDLTPVIADNTIDPDQLTLGAPHWNSTGYCNVSGDFEVDGNMNVDKLFESSGVGGRAFIQRDQVNFASNSITFSTADPSGGSDGDIWIKHAA